LAHTLIRRGVRRGDVVGVYLDRSIEHGIELVTAVLKAGAGYTLLDPKFPIDRLTSSHHLKAWPLSFDPRSVQPFRPYNGCLPESTGAPAPQQHECPRQSTAGS
jgi:non-ribosomal peptide synthetase component F